MSKKMADWSQEDINEVYRKVNLIVESAAFVNEGEEGTNKWMNLADMIVNAKEIRGDEKNIALVILGYKMGIEAAKRQQTQMGSNIMKEAERLLEKFSG